MNIKPYSRRIEVDIDQMLDAKRGTALQSITIPADGTTNGLRIQFHIFKQVISTGHPSTIKIYNLSNETRNLLKRDKNILLTVRVGWANTGLTKVFEGNLLAAHSQREGADIVTTMYALSGFGAMSRKQVQLSFTQGTSINAVVSALAKTLSETFGIIYDENYISLKTRHFGNQGYSFAGSISDALDKLSRQYGFSWSIHNGLFQAVDDDKAFPTAIDITSDNGYLVRAEPMLSTPYQLQGGVTIHSFLNPNISPGYTINLKSNLNPFLNGPYKVHTVNHSGDSHSPQWSSNTETWQIYNMGGTGGQ